MVFHRPLALLAGIAGATALTFGCSSSKGTTNPPPPPTVNTISKFSGDSQVGSTNAALGANLVVFVKDQNNAPVSGATVTWTALAGGGSVTSSTSQTDANGHAAMGRTLGPAAGFQTTSASLSGATGSPITFNSISQLGGAFQLTAGTGGGQSDTVLSTLPNPMQAVATDYQGNPVAGVIVAFSVSGSGSLTAVHDTTDASGHATATLILTSVAGPRAVRATVTGLVGSPVSFTAQATAGNATQIIKSLGDSQAGLIGTTLPAPHLVLVQDAYGNGASGVTIQWAVGSGGGSVSNTGPTSDATGIVSVTRTLGGLLGLQSDTAKATLTGSPIVFISLGDSITHVGAVTVGPGISYAPTSVTVGSLGKGSIVTWTWTGSLPHGVEWLTAPGTKPTNSVVQSAGTYSWAFTDPGTYTYDCLVHGSAMTGTIVVK